MPTVARNGGNTRLIVPAVNRKTPAALLHLAAKPGYGRGGFVVGGFSGFRVG